MICRKMLKTAKQNQKIKNNRKAVKTLSKDNSPHNNNSGQAAIFSQIFTFVILIIVLLLMLLWVVNKDRLDELDLPIKTEDKNVHELIDETKKLINNITDTISIYSIQKDQDALEKFSRIINKLTEQLKKHSFEDINPVLGELNEMTDALSAFVDTHSLKNTKLPRENLIRKLERLNDYLEKYPVKDVGQVMKKLSDIIEKLKSDIKKPEKTENHKTSGKYTWIPHKKPRWSKPDFHSWVLEYEPEILRFPIGDKITTDEIIEEKVEKKDNIFGKTICLGHNQNSNTVHIMENQMLIKIIALDLFKKTASLDISHPTLGLRRFTNMEQGTRRPFEYGKKTYFCELIEIVNKKCVNISVYERQEIAGK